MVAGHAISRPRIQLERVDTASIAQAGEQQQVREAGEVFEEPVTEEVSLSPMAAAPMSRNVFDLTNNFARKAP